MAEGRKTKSVRNITYAFGAKAITLFIGLFSRFIFLHFLTTEYLGLNGLFSNVLTLLSLAELGFGNVMLFNLYKPLKENDNEKLAALMNLYKKAYSIIGIGITVAGLFCIPFLGFIIGEAPTVKVNITVVYVMFLLNTSLSYLFSYKQTLLTADQKDYVISKYTSLIAILREILQILVLFLTHNYYAYLIVLITTTVGLNIILSIYVDRNYSWIKDRKAELPEKEKNSILTDVKVLAISKVSGISFNGTDSIIITKICGLAQVGLAANYSLIINNVFSLVNGSLSGLVGSIGNLNAEDDVAHKKSIFDQLFTFSYLIYSYIAIALICLCDVFIKEVWLGNQYILSRAVCISLVLIIYQSGMNFPAYTFRVTHGIFDKMQWVYVFAAIMNIFVSIWFGKLWGLAGVYFATSLSKAVTTEIGDGYFTYKMALNEKPIKYFTKYFGLLLLMFVNLLITEKILLLINITGLIGFLVKGIICTIICNVINIVVLCRTNGYKNLVQSIKSMLKRK